MKLKQISIRKLFGVFDHDITLNTRDRITIIHGPNGVGKTTVLQLVHNIFGQKFHSVAKTPFRSVRLKFDNSTVLSIHRFERNGNYKLTAKLSIPKTKKKYETSLLTSHGSNKEIAKKLRLPIHAIEDVIPNLDQHSPNEWFDTSTGDMLSLTEVVLRYGDELPISQKVLAKVPPQFTQILESFPVYFIQTQRLLTDDLPDRSSQYDRREDRRRTRSQVQRWARDMSRRLREKLGQSGALSASLDRQFPSTLLGGQLPAEASEEKIREIYKDQTEYRNRLMKAGLIAEETLLALPGGKIAESDLKVLWFYFRDVKEKLSVFEDLLPKIELFRDIINSRFLWKSFTVNRKGGFSITSDKESPIPLNTLSSGEQHELVLAYELLFKVNEKSLILVDEPELSLHVTWQHKFLDDITRISELVDIDFLIATHSPSIIHTRTDLMTELS